VLALAGTAVFASIKGMVVPLEGRSLRPRKKSSAEEVRVGRTGAVVGDESAIALEVLATELKEQIESDRVISKHQKRGANYWTRPSH